MPLPTSCRERCPTPASECLSWHMIYNNTFGLISNINCLLAWSVGVAPFHYHSETFTVLHVTAHDRRSLSHAG